MTLAGRLKLLNSYQTRNKTASPSSSLLHKKLPVSLLISHLRYAVVRVLQEWNEYTQVKGENKARFTYYLIIYQILNGHLAIVHQLMHCVFCKSQLPVYSSRILANLAF